MPLSLSVARFVMTWIQGAAFMDDVDARINFSEEETKIAVCAFDILSHQVPHAHGQPGTVPYTWTCRGTLHVES